MEQNTGASKFWETLFQQLEQIALDIERRKSTQKSLELFE